MFLLKYKHGDDTFYRLTGKKNPSTKNILFEAPVAPAITAKRVNNALAMIEKAIREPEEDIEEVVVEDGKEVAKKKMASSIISNFLKAE